MLHLSPFCKILNFSKPDSPLVLTRRLARRAGFVFEPGPSGAEDTLPPFRFGDNRAMTGSANVDSNVAEARPCKVALVGFGTVGSSVARILSERAHLNLLLTHVLNRNVERKKVDWLPSSVKWTDNIHDVVASDVDIVVEVMGGLEPAEDWIRRVLESGKSVVTA